MSIKLSLVVPVYNEEKRIKESLKKIFEFMKTQDYLYEVLVSDDGSTDSTLQIVEAMKSNWPQLRVLSNKHKGKAPAIISGIKNSGGELVLFTDVDLSVSIDQLSRFLGWIDHQGFDVAIATREGIGAERIGEPLMRHIMGRVFNYLVQIMVLPGINDTQCGFKLLKSHAAKAILSKTRLYNEDSPEISGAKVSGFDVELLFVARKLGYKIKEVPVVWVYSENSKVHSFKDSYYNAKDVMKVRLNSLRRLYD